MGGCIHTVGGDFVFDDGLGGQVQILLGRSAHGGVGRKHHYAELVFRADHAERLHAAYLALLDLEVSWQHGADAGEEHLLAGGHIGSAAHDGKGLGAAVVNLRDVQMVRIGMGLAFQHFRHHHACEAAGNGFRLLQRIHLDTDGCHYVRHLLRRKVALQIIFKPVVRNLHILFL